MKGFYESDTDPIAGSSRNNFSCTNSPKISPGSVSGEAEPGSKHQTSAALWSGIWAPTISIFRHQSGSPKKSECKSCTVVRKQPVSGKNYYEGWSAAVRRVIMNGGSMRRILGFSRANVSNSNSDIWLLGVCYHLAQEGEDSSDPTQSEGFAAFVEDFSSRILITYRKGSAQCITILFGFGIVRSIVQCWLTWFCLIMQVFHPLVTRSTVAT